MRNHIKVGLKNSGKGKIPLFFWSERKFQFKDKENYGDLIGKYLVEKITGRSVRFVHPKKRFCFIWYRRNYLTAGSILHHATKSSIVWGSGIIDHEQEIARADFRAVRGPQTRNYLLNLGYECPKIFGDPALLLPKFYNPRIGKKYEIGIIPHYHDYQIAVELFRGDSKITVINLMTLDVEEVTKKILECEMTLSSSLHGMVVSHAYNIPSVWVEFSKNLFGDGVKFRDYLESINLTHYVPKYIEEKFPRDDLLKFIKHYPASPKPEKIQELQQDLLNHCPF